MEVLNELKPGLDEKLYERAMIIELKRGGHHMAIQRSFPVFFRGELIGSLVWDLIVDDAVIVDPKVVACFTDTHISQMIGYPKHHGTRPRASHEFQKRSIGMETRSTHAGARGSSRT